MKKFITNILVVTTILLLSACSSTQSLQEYYVDNTANPNFISLDVPASILNLQEAELSKTQRQALESLKKLNVLAFKINSSNAQEYQIEKTKVNAILKQDKFVELMKLNSKYGKGVIKYLGDENAIDEVIIFGSSDEKGFALIRVLGDDMNPAHLIQLVKAIQTSDYNAENLGDIGEFLKG
ncbi:MAG: DUF4252 domain-containing protein [Flavobacteriaceae bacterium]